MRVHQDWSTPGFELEPAAPALGPFPRRGFLETWWRHRGAGELLLVESDRALLPLSRDGDCVQWVGEADLTDYHSPLGPDAAATLSHFAAGLDAGVRVVLDSMPQEAARLVVAGLDAAAMTVASAPHEVAAVLVLPATYDDYLARLSSKQRHEIRRKRRRFTEALGQPAMERTAARFEDFVAMHRAAAGRKGSFMTGPMERFFRDLSRLSGAVLDVLIASDGSPVAAAFGFEDAEGYYLYNTAYDPGAAHASPGVVLVDELISRSIARGHRRFDFLKGDEVYKFRLGAEARPLFRVEAVR